MTNPPPNADFTIAWICPSRLEFVAARETFDLAYGKHPQILHHSDTNAYELGKIGRNNVIIICLPPFPAAERPWLSRYEVYKQMKTTFPSVKVGIFVAVGSGIPSALHDIRLGDVVVATPEREFWGVVELEHVSPSASASASASGPASTTLDLKCTNLLSPKHGYSHFLTTAVHALTADRALGVPSKIPSFLSKMFEWYPEKRAVYAYPGVADEVLLWTDYNRGSHHNPNMQSVISRPARADCTRPVVHSGTIAAADKSVTDVFVRGRWREDLGIKGIPVLVVCGVGDYAGSHGDGGWRGYAAATAAAYAKELLRTLAALPTGETGCGMF
ncbi:hypothetical protein BDW66DRAFT_159351 [Aspergillus desertorum]